MLEKSVDVAFHDVGRMILEDFLSFSEFVMMKLGMGAEPCTSRADLREKNLVKVWKDQPGVD